jgi:hypothetical protein
MANHQMKDREIIADNLTKAGWSWCCVSAVDANGRTIWIVDAHRDDAKRFIVHADDKLSAFIELEREVLTVTFYLESIHADSCREIRVLDSTGNVERTIAFNESERKL